MVAVYRGVFVDDCPIWSGAMISFASSLASVDFKIKVQLIWRFDATAGDDGRDSQVVGSVVVDEQSCGVDDLWIEVCGKIFAYSS
jgi:hypothetical protein